MNIFLIVYAVLSIYAKFCNSQCNVCNTTSLVACFSVDQYIPCDVNNVLNIAAIQTCATGTLCNQNKGVGTPCGAGWMVTCPAGQVALPTTLSTAATTISVTTAASTGTTVPLSTFNANTFCAAKPKGRYPHPSYTTCLYYVYCYPFNATMAGATYTCMGTTRFNAITQICDPNLIC